MIQVHYPPETPRMSNGTLHIFLAGTIDMGHSHNWQLEMIRRIEEQFNHRAETMVEVCNPRRHDWNPEWEQSPTNPMFKRQVEWELERLEKADLILMVLLPESMSPISLMELGSFKNKPMMVYNPEKFYRWGNVEIFCKRNNIQTFNDWDDYCMAVRRIIDSYVLKFTNSNYDA